MIENRPGADGLLAINAFIAANDDHVLLYASTASFMAHPYTLEKMPYNLERDFAPIARVTDTVLAVSVPSAVKANSMKEFVALAKAQPGKLNAAGAAGVPDFTLGYFLNLENLDVTRIPTRMSFRRRPISAPGRSSSCFRPMRSCAPPGVRPYQDPRDHGRERSSFAPDIPTIHEAGFPALNVETTAGFYGPRGMAQDLRERIAKDVIAVVAEPEITKRLVATGQAVRTGGPAELAQTLKPAGRADARPWRRRWGSKPGSSETRPRALNASGVRLIAADRRHDMVTLPVARSMATRPWLRHRRGLLCAPRCRSD